MTREGHIFTTTQSPDSLSSTICSSFSLAWSTFFPAPQPLVSPHTSRIICLKANVIISFWSVATMIKKQLVWPSTASHHMVLTCPTGFISGGTEGPKHMVGGGKSMDMDWRWHSGCGALAAKAGRGSRTALRGQNLGLTKDFH